MTGYAAIIPCVSHGNVPQLAIDLMIYSLKMKKYATIWHKDVIPIIGSCAYDITDVGNLSTATELYVDNQNKLLLLQLRSPIINKKESDFIKQLSKYLSKLNLTDVTILSSSFSYENYNIENLNMWYKSNKSEFYDNKLDSNWSQFFNEKIRGGGYAISLLKQLSDENIPSIILFKYVSEGDNRNDAKEYIKYMNSLHKIVDKLEDLKEPPSWKFLFGKEPTYLIDGQLY